MPITQELCVPAQSGERGSGSNSSARLSGTPGSLRALFGEPQLRTIVGLWAIEAILFAIAVLRRMGYQ